MFVEIKSQQTFNTNTTKILKAIKFKFPKTNLIQKERILHLNKVLQ